MALEKIQAFIQKMSETPKVKQVVSDIQTLSEDIQKRVQDLNTKEAVKKYKDIAKKVTKAEADLQKEVKKVVSQLRSSADGAEKNLELYKKKALAQKAKIEKMIQAKRAEFTGTPLKSKAQKAAPRAKAAVKAVASKARKTVKKASKKKASAKKAV
ncbi:MAG: hypothetical protein K2P92_06505 [Bdellovibrionaceae bacterium]|nr:hypothetical protein [Pseudobdellovibrionaceae bacterium]